MSWANHRSLSWELFVAPSFSLRLLCSASPGAGLVLPLHRQYLRSPLSFPTTISLAAPALWLLGRCRPSSQFSNCTPDRFAELGISTLSSTDLELRDPKPPSSLRQLTACPTFTGLLLFPGIGKYHLGFTLPASKTSQNHTE